MTGVWMRRRRGRCRTEVPRAHLFVDGQGVCKNAGRGPQLFVVVEVNPVTKLPDLFCMVCQKAQRVGGAVTRVLDERTDRRALWIRALESMRPASLRGKP